MSMRFAVVGCGGIAEELHIPTLINCPDVELVAAVDSDRHQAISIAKKYGIGEALQDLADTDAALDAVVICTPPNARPKLIAQAFSMGLHVLAEKPLANSSAECASIVQLCGEAQRVLAVSHMFRFYPVRWHLHQIIELHDLGAIRSIDITEGAPYAWITRSGYTFKRGEVSGGVVINAGIHSLDSLIQWFGDPLIESYEDDSLGGLESNARVRLVFPFGITASFRISRTCRLPSIFRVTCERGAVVFSNRDTVEYRIAAGSTESKHRFASGDETPEACWRAQLMDFVGSIRSGVRPRVDGLEASRVVSLVEEMYRLKRSRPWPKSAPTPGATW